MKNNYKDAVLGELNNKLLEYSSIDIVPDENVFIHPLTSYEVELANNDIGNNEKISDYFKFIRKIFSRIRANPNDKIVIEQGNAVYYSVGAQIINNNNEFLKHEDGNPLCNNHYGTLQSQEYYDLGLPCKFSGDFYELIANNEYCALIGGRGIGKTSFISKWLNNHTKTILESNLNYNWCRIDVSKLYELYSDSIHKNNVQNIDWINFFKIQNAFTFLIYSGALAETDTKIKDYIKKRNLTTSLQLSSIKIFLDDIGNSKFIDSEELKNKYKKSKNIIASQFMHHILRYDSDKIPILNKRLWGIHDEFLFKVFKGIKSNKLYKALINIFDLVCIAMEEKEIGLLCIIDGLDNVSWSKNNILYQRMCNASNDFIDFFHDSIPLRKRKLLLVARPETLAELETPVFSRGGANDPTGSRHNFATMELTIANTELIFTTKRDAAISNKSFSSERTIIKDIFNNTDKYKELNDIFSKKIDHFINDFSIDAKNNIDSIINLFGNDFMGLALMDDLSFTQKDNLVVNIFNSDIRELLLSFLNSFELGYCLTKKGVVMAEQEERIKEYLLLNQKTYLDSREKNSHRYEPMPEGQVFPNIYWFDEHTRITGDKWHGLCGLRILQLITLKGNNTSPGDMLYTLHIMFDYNKAILIEHFEAFVAYGLLDVKWDHRELTHSYCNDDERFTKYKNRVVITCKGKYVAAMSLYDVDWIYFLALDTPLFQNHTSNMFIRFYLFPQDNNRQYQFFDAYIITVATFIRYIRSFYKIEMNKLKSNCEEKISECIGLFSNCDSVSRSFVLPIDKITTRLENAMFESLAKRYDGIGDSDVLNFSFEELKTDIDNLSKKNS